MLGEWATTALYHQAPIFTNFIQSEKIVNATETDIEALK